MPRTSEARPLRDRRFALARHFGDELPSPCRVDGCPNATSDRKPYCLAHLDRLPYVREIRAELARREVEVARALGGVARRAPDPGGSRAQDILTLLDHAGAQTLDSLRWHVQLPRRAVERYVRSLELAGFVRVRTIGSRRDRLRRLVVPTAPAG